ncbi:phospholipase D/nuclease [Lichtheimia hyalospora FSU 10163]|nr:phospholipase D/nuclease [Lichtheimia hyalospora FSU 10163]
MDWIEEQFPSHINLCVVLHGRPAMARQLSTTRTFIVPPLKDENWGVFHPKLMILVHENSMRIVIGSANLERYDYNDLENVVFIQDFPLASKATTSITHLPRFARDIANLLEQMHVPSSVQDELLKYDFSRAKAHVVASVSGNFQGHDQYRQYGHARLAQIIREIGAADPNRPPRIEMQTSSLGGLNASYLHELYRSFSGIDPYETSSKPVRMKNNEPLPPIDIIYPSMDTVLDSRLGPPGAGTICLNTSSWQKPTFPKQVMCDAISHRPRTLMHSKVNIHWGRILIMDDDRSHNATMGAWGKLSIARDSKQPKMSINNWELGVVLPLYEDSDIPVTYIRPPPRYRTGQDAWTQE